MSKDALKVDEGSELSARRWNRLVDAIPDRAVGAPAGVLRLNSEPILCLNGTGVALDTGNGIAISKTWAGPSDINSSLAGFTVTGYAVSWHSALPDIAVCLEPIPNGEYGYVAMGGRAFVQLSGGDGGYVLPDPCDLTKFKRSTGGIAAVIAANGTFALVDFGRPQPFFRYRRTGEYFETGDACLVDFEGATFGPISLYDPEGITDDQSFTDTGLCMMTGNKFVVVNANCLLSGASSATGCDCPDPSSSV